MLKFLKHRIADRRMLRLICKWLKAGVIEEGCRVAANRGTPQGAVISPLLANIYLHYALELWARQWRRRHAQIGRAHDWTPVTWPSRMPPSPREGTTHEALSS